MINFTMVPKEVLYAKNLSEETKVVYFLLVDYAYNSVYCFPSLETLCEKLGVSDRTVKRATKELREFGLIRIFRDTKRSNNVYVLMPVAWVKNLFSENSTPVPEGEQYLETKDEFDALVAKVKAYYEEIGRKVSLGSSKSSGRRGSARTQAEIIAGIERRMEAGDYDFNNRDLCVVFAKCYRERYNALYNFSKDWKLEQRIMKEVFLSNGVSAQDAVRVISKFIEVYDNTFKRDGYELPKVQQLRVQFILRKVMQLVVRELEREEAVEDDSPRVHF